MGIDTDLKSRLEGFAKDLLSQDHPVEGVSVEVKRGVRFRNEVRTGRGLQAVIDEPLHFGGEGTAPDPAEFLLAAAGASLSVTMTAHAALRGIDIRELAMSIAADIDGRSFFHPSAAPRIAGLLGARIILTVTTDAPRRELRELLNVTLLASPVLRALRRRPHVTLQIKRIKVLAC